jgi:sulfatase modifying factor 1
MNHAIRVCFLAWAIWASGCGGAKFDSASNAKGGSSGGPAGAAGSDSSTGGVPGAAGSSSSDAGSGGAAMGGVTGDAGQGGDTVVPVSECPCAAPKPTCEAGKCIARGPTMIKAGPFYVDSTEVTSQEYAAFLLAKGSDVSQQAAECAWNDSFEPAAPAAAPQHPVTDIDFCDAAAYCAWADKRLCGKIGGGALLFQELSVPTKSQWFAACAGPNAQPYPYGSSHQAGVCNDSSGKTADVRSYAGCNGFYKGVYDMIGNAAEWVDACDGSSGAADGCETTGGSFANASACTGSGLRHRNEQSPSVGFRCCSLP